MNSDSIIMSLGKNIQISVQGSQLIASVSTNEKGLREGPGRRIL